MKETSELVVSRTKIRTAAIRYILLMGEAVGGGEMSILLRLRKESVWRGQAADGGLNHVYTGPCVFGIPYLQMPYPKDPIGSCIGTAPTSWRCRSRMCAPSAYTSKEGGVEQRASPAEVIC